MFGKPNLLERLTMRARPPRAYQVPRRAAERRRPLYIYSYLKYDRTEI